MMSTTVHLFCWIFVVLVLGCCQAFAPHHSALPSSAASKLRQQTSPLRAWNKNKNEATIEEKSRLEIYESRRGQIRGSLKAAEALRNFRVLNGYVPELDEDGKPIKSDGKFALTSTAFVVAFGAIAIRIGGRAALISAVGLDFLTENLELQGQMNQVLAFSESMDPLTKLAVFCLAWTVVKVSCLDFGGVALALSSGILFGGVFQGAFISAFGATVGSSVAFGLAKLDTPIRKKALEIVDDNPSLRGIEKVVAKDGLKAVLTLRLAPVLPIPIGFYNYVYGVTNVPYFDFAGGIFLGSLKPYLLDSYIGSFGKSLVDGTAGADGGIQDIVLLVAFGVSVLIGVFASQLAGETWDSVLKEAEAEKAEAGTKEQKEDDGIVREVMGRAMPQWIVGFQISLKEADVRINNIIAQEFDAKVWNYTKSDGLNPIPRSVDPAFFPGSPELVGAYKGIDFSASICEGLVLSPSMFAAFSKYADPLFYEETEAEIRKMASPNAKFASKSDSAPPSKDITKEDLLDRLGALRTTAQQRLQQLEGRVEKEDKQR
jgi:uncharacterized membrane protein YdjX (TVP38/TMEM64 family)